MPDIVGYLRSKGVAVKEVPPDNIHCACFFCGEANNKRGRLYININSEPPGLYKCHLCGDTGAFNRIRKHFGDPAIWDDKPEAKGVEQAAYNRLEILNEAAAYYHDLLADHEKAYLYLRDERGFTLETIQDHQFGWADGTLANHLIRVKKYPENDVKATGLVDQFGRDFFQDYLTIPYLTNGNVVQIRGRKLGESSHGAKYKTPSGQKARLFNTDLVWNAKEVILTEGEFDAVVLEQLGYAAVGVPGAVSWSDAWNDYFQNARKAFIVFDNDSAGDTGAEKVARAIGPRSRIVKMPEHGPGEAKNDPTEWLVNKGHSRDDFQMLLIQAKGGHLLTVYDGYAEWRDTQLLEGLKLGLELIDFKIKPGLLPGQVMVILAKTGVGKTLLTLNIFHRMSIMNPDVKILFVSLEQTRGEWFDRARKIFRFYNPTMSDEAVLEFFRDRLLIIDKNRISEEELVSCLEQYEFEIGQKPDLVAIDYLGYWARGYRGEPYERTSAAIMALKAIAKEHRIAFLTPHQVSRVAHFGEEIEADASRDSGVVEETADFMMTLWSEDQRKGREESEKTGLVTLKVVKSRHGGSGTRQSLQFAPASLAMIPVGDTALAAAAKNEHLWVQQRDDYDLCIYRHATGDDRLAVPRDELDAWTATLSKGMV